MSETVIFPTLISRRPQEASLSVWVVPEGTITTKKIKKAVMASVSRDFTEDHGNVHGFSKLIRSLRFPNWLHPPNRSANIKSVKV